jgi:hypothetical protein
MTATFTTSGFGDLSLGNRHLFFLPSETPIQHSGALTCGSRLRNSWNVQPRLEEERVSQRNTCPR